MIDITTKRPPSNPLTPSVHVLSFSYVVANSTCCYWSHLWFAAMNNTLLCQRLSHIIYIYGGMSTYSFMSAVLSAYSHCFNYINIQLCTCSTTVVVITSTMVVVVVVSCRRPERWAAVRKCLLKKLFTSRHLRFISCCILIEW